MVVIVISFILLISSFPAQAVHREKLNFEFAKRIAENALTRPMRHKVPSFYKEDDLVNLVDYSEMIVQNILSFPAEMSFSTLSIDILKTRNELALDLLQEVEVSQSEGISRKVALKIMERAYHHAVVGREAMDKYDPINSESKTKKYGFCFVRADYIYFELRKFGVKRENIFKLFQIGKINGDPTFGRPWSYHVVTLVKSIQGGWWAIDPFYRFVGSPREWYKINMAKIQMGRSLLYLTSPERMFAQGGVHTFPALMDETFPIIQPKFSKTLGHRVRHPERRRIPFKDKLVMKFLKEYFYSLIAEIKLEKANSIDYFKHKKMLCTVYEICL